MLRPDARRDPRGLTFPWAVTPVDADTGESLLSCADERRLANKRTAKQLV
jgi:hypothetical protein